MKVKRFSSRRVCVYIRRNSEHQHSGLIASVQMMLNFNLNVLNLVKVEFPNWKTLLGLNQAFKNSIVCIIQ